MGIVEIILLIAGSGGVSGFVTWAVTVKAQKKKENAIADQEVIRAKFDLNAFENQIFERVTNRMQLIIDEQEKHIGELKENQSQLLIANNLMQGKIDVLEKMVQDYKETCDNCQFRLEKKKK
jgi:hypothetical protein